MDYVKVRGTGHSVPEKAVSNNELAKYVDTSDEWIKSRTGIENRYIAKDETVVSLATEASKEATEMAGLSPLDIDLIIVATISSEQAMPSAACLVQKELGAKNSICFDISAACSGFLYAFQIASQGIESGLYKNALVIGSEVLSKVINWEDRNTCVLFGDGAGAAILSKANKRGVIKTYLGSDGEGSDLLTLGAANDSANYIEMNGRQVYKFAVNIIPKCIKELLVGTEYTKGDIDYFVLHQANERIIDSIAKKMGINIEKFYKNMKTYGNTSGASIPIALNELNKKGSLQKGDLIALVGFGGGLTWGASLIKW